MTVSYDEAALTADDVRALIERFGCSCGGEVVPCHLCRDEQPAVIGSTVPHGAPHAPSDEHAGHAMAAPAAGAPVQGEMAQMAHGMGHGGGMTMDEMVRDMRNRFIVAFILAIPIFLYSPLATEVFNIRLGTPFGVDPNILAFLLATPAVAWSGKMFFVGAWRALRNRTLDMSVLVALSVGSGYLFSVAATFLFKGEVFYEAAVVLLTFVLFGHWLEMRPGGRLGRDEGAPRPHAAEGDRHPERRAGRGPDIGGRARRRRPDPARRQGARATASSRTEVRPSTNR